MFLQRLDSCSKLNWISCYIIICGLSVARDSRLSKNIGKEPLTLPDYGVSLPSIESQYQFYAEMIMESKGPKWPSHVTNDVVACRVLHYVPLVVWVNMLNRFSTYNLLYLLHDMSCLTCWMHKSFTSSSIPLSVFSCKGQHVEGIS